MSRQEIYNMLVRAKRPIDCFGDVKDEKALKKEYLRLAKLIHPDTANEREVYISTNGFELLNALYKSAVDEFQKGIYFLRESIDIYAKSSSLFSLDIHNRTYKFYEKIYEGEIADIYKGVCDKEIVCLKLCLDESDNDLLQKEYETLKAYSHQSLPIVRDFIKINDCAAIVMDEIKGENLVDIMKRNPKGLNPEVVMWVMERLFSAVGYLHSNYIVHSNLIPENIIINKDNHNVSISGFSFHIAEANKGKNFYKIKNEDFSAPEVSKDEPVFPQSDIYMLGKLAIYMLGGDLKTTGMPINIDVRIRSFIRKMVEEDKKKRSNDAWKLWDEWREIRRNVYGDAKFKQIKF